MGVWDVMLFVSFLMREFLSVYAVVVCLFRHANVCSQL